MAFFAVFLVFSFFLYFSFLAVFSFLLASSLFFSVVFEFMDDDDWWVEVHRRVEGFTGGEICENV